MGHGATPERRRVIVLGSTGSIGRQALEVAAHVNELARAGRSPVSIEIVGLSAGRNGDLLREQGARFSVNALALDDAEIRSAPGVSHAGPGSAERLVRDVECDVVLAAIVGSAGLPATLAAVSLGRDVALANKETLVAAGALVIPEARRTGVRLLPVDSEHSAVLQAMRGVVSSDCCPPLIAPESVSRVVLTASGGPFRLWDAARIERATRAEALRHPTWSMGEKVTVDCASLMNKGLELIEAHWLFGLGAERLGVAIHPQSIAHALVEIADGSVLAQLGAPDMRTPIQIALTHPHRIPGIAPAPSGSLSLEFEQPDMGRFPALRLALDAITRGGTAGAILNAANEEAVNAFLRERITFGRIVAAVRETIEAIDPGPLTSLDDIFEAERRAREFARRRLNGRA